MQTILTGLRSNDDLTLGNYLGGIEPTVRMAKKHLDDSQINMFLPDLHTFTVPVDHSTLYQKSINHLRMYVAAGLPVNEPNVDIYRQSRVPAHSELCVILNNLTSFGALTRMVEFKDKSERKDTEFVSVGLFDYPVLMAGDILLYGAKYIPLGDDQRQHVELTRDIAERFNNKFGETFVVPAPIPEQAKFVGLVDQVRIMSLTNPEKKMSKSIKDPNGTILLKDDPKEAAKKVMGATTDSMGAINFDKKNQPGITNLLVLLALLEGKSQEEINAEFVGQTQYGELKKRVAGAVEETLIRLQNAYEEVDVEKLEKTLLESEEKMRGVANETLLKVQKAVGLRE